MKQVEGFTLTEIIIAAVIMATAIAGLFASFIAAKRYTVASKDQLMAVHNAQYVLEQLRQDVRADIWDTGNLALTGAPVDVISWLPDGPNTLRGKYGDDDVEASYQVSEVPDPQGSTFYFRKVDLTITWPDQQQ